MLFYATENKIEKLKLIGQLNKSLLLSVKKNLVLCTPHNNKNDTLGKNSCDKPKVLYIIV